MFLITKDFEFSAAHQIPGHPKCGRMHGHNYKVTVGLKSQTLKQGMVMDYGDLKALVAPVIDLLDHRYLCGAANIPNLGEELMKAFTTVSLPMDITTAENLAKWLAEVIGQKLPPRVDIHYVKVQETSHTSATYFPEPEVIA